MLWRTLPETIKMLEAIGYVVAIGTAYGEPQDGFALLKDHMIYVAGEKGLNSHLKGVTLDQLKNMPKHADKTI